MDFIADVFGREIRFTYERWNYIIHYHPEMAKLRKEFQSTVGEPDLIVRSVHDPEVVLYYRYFENVFDGKCLVATVKLSTDSFILNGYITDRVKEGEVIWKKD